MDGSNRIEAQRENAPSPFLAQYFAAKTKHPDALLFFRMGDFYELFFQDAEQAAAALGITLTRRGQHKGDPIPMAGVPWHQAELYLAKLIRAGFKVAVCEQMEDPAEAKKRGSKSIVHRDVVRLITPGTLTEDALLDARAPNLLAACAFAGEAAALAWADISTGAFETRLSTRARLAEDLAALNAAEILVADAEAGQSLFADKTLLRGAVLTPRPSVKADIQSAKRRAKAIFEVAELEAFGDFSDVEFAAIGLLLDYVELTQAGAAPRLAPPRRQGEAAFLAIDPATRLALEIDRSQRGEREGSLLSAIDRTVTSAGGRIIGRTPSAAVDG